MAERIRPPKKILVIMLRRIGDVLLTTPAVRALGRLFPEAAIDFLAEPPCHEALEGDPRIRRVLAYGEAGSPLANYVGWLGRVRRERYDWVIDYMGNPRSAVLTAASGAAVRAGPGHVAHRWAYSHKLAQSTKACYAGLEKIRVLRSLGLDPDESDFLPSLAVSEASRRKAERALAGLWPGRGADGPVVGLVPASRRETRRWPAAYYAKLARLLAERRSARALVVWGPGERELAEEVARASAGAAAAAPETPRLKDLAGLLSRCGLVVTNCNGPKHVAVACGVPTLTVHGSSDPVCWNPPDGPRHRVARLDGLFCVGCRLNECPYGLECMRQLTPERVAAQAESMLTAALRLGAPR